MKITKGAEEALEGDGCIYGLDGSVGFTNVHLPPNLSKCIHYIRTALLHVNNSPIKWFKKINAALEGGERQKEQT